jgi:hypothetical protein
VLLGEGGPRYSRARRGILSYSVHAGDSTWTTTHFRCRGSRSLRLAQVSTSGGAPVTALAAYLPPSVDQPLSYGFHCALLLQAGRFKLDPTRARKAASFWRILRRALVKHTQCPSRRLAPTSSTLQMDPASGSFRHQQHLIKSGRGIVFCSIDMMLRVSALWRA